MKQIIFVAQRPTHCKRLDLCLNRTLPSILSLESESIGQNIVLFRNKMQGLGKYIKLPFSLYQLSNQSQKRPQKLQNTWYPVQGIGVKKARKGRCWLPPLSNQSQDSFDHPVMFCCFPAKAQSLGRSTRENPYIIQDGRTYKQNKNKR